MYSTNNPWIKPRDEEMTLKWKGKLAKEPKKEEIRQRYLSGSLNKEPYNSRNSNQYGSA
jgi:hypothetical protein